MNVIDNRSILLVLIALVQLVIGFVVCLTYFFFMFQVFVDKETETAYWSSSLSGNLACFCPKLEKGRQDRREIGA